MRVAADAGFAVRLYQAPDAGDYEYAVLLGFLDGGLRQKVEEGCDLLVSEFQLLGQVPYQSGLCQSSCHVMFSFVASPRGCRSYTGFRREMRTA